MLATIGSVKLIETHFGSLRDPRAEHSTLHKLLDILVITICEADNFLEIVKYGKERN
jgi:hypothetical protein